MNARNCECKKYGPMASCELCRGEKMRVFDTGAIRDSDDNKIDYEGFLSPFALKRYAEYLHKHRIQADGKLRDSDNWQKGIPIAVYMKSLWRHMMELWYLHRRYLTVCPPWNAEVKKEESLCAVIFNAMGCLHEITKSKNGEN